LYFSKKCVNFGFGLSSVASFANLFITINYDDCSGQLKKVNNFFEPCFPGTITLIHDGGKPKVLAVVRNKINLKSELK